MNECRPHNFKLLTPSLFPEMFKNVLNGAKFSTTFFKGVEDET